MDAKVYSRLNKLMMLTQSENDGEALVALRKANAILADHHWNWDTIFQKGGNPASQSTYCEDEKEDEDEALHDEIMEAFAVAFADCTDDFRGFLQSLHTRYLRTGYLSEKQLSALFKSRDRVRRRQKQNA